VAAGAEGDEEAGGCVSFEGDMGRGGEEGEEAGLGEGVSVVGDKRGGMCWWGRRETELGFEGRI